MAYKQLKAFDKSKAGKVKNACLANVRKGFSINSKWPTAWSAWQNTDQHTGDIPTGVDVPVYFWYLNADNGHIGVRLANGKFWSDGVEYDNINAYNLAGHTPSYRGWSTSVDGVPVLTQVADPVPVPSKRVPKSIFLKATVSAYAFYHVGTPLPVKRANRAGELNPKKWGGLTYNKVVATVDANTFEVVSPSLGNIIIWCGDNDSVVTY